MTTCARSTLPSPTRLRHRSSVLRWTAASAVVAALGAFVPLAAPSAGAASPSTSTSSAAPSTAPPAWPGALHDSAHSGTTAALGPQTARVLWTRQLEANVTPGPAVGLDGTIYLSSNAGVLHALDPTTGADRWTVNGGGPVQGEQDISITPLVLPDGSLLWSGPTHKLLEISPTGSITWSHQFSGQILSPVRSGGTVYLVTMNGTVSALRLSGSEPTVAWTVRIGHPSFGSPVVARPNLVVTTAGSHLVAIVDHGSHGAIAWQHQLRQTVEVSASVDRRGNVYVTDNSGAAYSFTSAGAARWHRHVGASSYSSSSVTPTGLLYIGDNSGNLSVLRASNGTTVRVVHTGHAGLWAAQVIDAHGDVYVGTQGKEVAGYGANGHLLFRLPVSGAVDSYPALSASGTLIVGDQRGTVYALGNPG